MPILTCSILLAIGKPCYIFLAGQISIHEMRIIIQDDLLGHHLGFTHLEPCCTFPGEQKQPDTHWRVQYLGGCL